MENYTDEQLIANYLKGDEKLLGILIKRYLKPIYNFAYRYTNNPQDSEDITQEVFIKAWHSFKKFNRQKSFKTWIFSIAKNTAIDFLRKKKAIPFSVLENTKGDNFFINTLADTTPISDELFEQTAVIRMLDSAMKQLPPKYRIVLSLRYNEHFTFREIAEILSESINTVKTRYRRGITILRGFF